MTAQALLQELGSLENGDRPVSVLLVEDNPGDARLVEEHLGSMSSLPSRLRWARSLQEGLDGLRSAPADVVLLDLSLPDSDGVETVRRLSEASGETPLLVLTGQEDPGTALWALRAGADEYVHKGELSPHVLSRAIRFAIERREMVAEQERYRTLFEEAQEAIVIARPDGTVVDANPAWHELFGYGPGDIEGLAVDDLYLRPDDRQRLATALESDGRLTGMEAQVRRADGSVLDCLLSAAVQRTATGEDEFVTFVRDISERKRFEKELQHRALHDVLTGLPNRGLLADRLEQAVARARRQDSAMAVFHMDVDRFKAINDSFGHETGDKILVSLARELEGAVRDEDTVARFGGDEFVVLTEGLGGPEDARAAAERLVETLRASEPCSSAPYHLTVSVGVAVCGGRSGACSAAEVLRQADIAMYRAKRSSGVTYHVFDPEEDGAGLGRMQREQELRRALEAREFVPVYQPVVDLGAGGPWGVELLARWEHPGRGRLGPGEFIPLAEESGLILTLDRQILDAGLRDFAAWRAGDGPAPERLLVNLSASQFEDPAFPDYVAEKLEEHGVPAEAVHFEVTETEIMQSTERIGPLAALGVRILIDDFGTGYSSLGYLRELDVDGLKVDMAFVHGITENVENRAIVETILTLGDRLGLEVVAEGIETAEQADELRAMGCRLGQGYLYARPVDAPEIAALLERGLPDV